MQVDGQVTNIPDNLQENMCSLYWAFLESGGKLPDLEKEWRRLHRSLRPVTSRAGTFAERWSGNIFGKDDTSLLARSRILLSQVFTEFEHSRSFLWIADRFELTASELLKKATPFQIFDWMLLWMLPIYPALALFLFGKEKVESYQPLKDLELKKVIWYLPRFMLWGLGAYLKGAWRGRLLRKLAEGQNIRRIPECPVPFTKKMAHYFVNAPKECRLKTAVWYGIVIGQGGKLWLVSAFQSYFNHWNRDMRFLKSLIDFFSLPGHQVNRRELRELLGYLQHIWDENASLSLKNWTLDRLRSRANEYYEEQNRIWLAELEGQALRAIEIDPEAAWEGAPYRTFDTKIENEVFQIVQIRSAKELYEEGREMRHCVGSYAWKCLEGEASIWSLQQLMGEQCIRLVTIEVSSNHQIVQVKRKLNAPPDVFHWNLIRMWAKQEHLDCPDRISG